MKLKNVKVGVRVELKKDCEDTKVLKKGMKGVIIGKVGDELRVSWDNFTNGHNGGYTNETDNFIEDSIWIVNIKDVCKVKSSKDI